MIGFYYLASPYSHPDHAVRQKRYELVRDGAARLLKSGVFVYAPIVHTHDMSQHNEMPYTFEFWDKYNKQMINASVGLALMPFIGWRVSNGLASEILYCKTIEKSIWIVTPDWKLQQTADPYKEDWLP